MKRLTLLITLIIFVACSMAQWELQNPIPTDADLQDIFFIDSENGWAVGQHGTILYSDDGGENWQLQLSIPGPLISTFSAVYFTDMLHGWAIGSSYVLYGGVWSSLIYHTDDGGSSWENQYSNPTEDFSDVWFANSDTGWVVGSESYNSDGIILFTADGGTNWVEQYRKDSVYISGICFADSYNGWAVGAQGLIVNTSDGGATWEEQNSNDIINFTSVCFTDLNNGWAVGGKFGFPTEAKILHTIDGGTTWEINYVFGDYVAFDVDAIFFVDGDNGWVTFDGQDGPWHFLITSDGGLTWDSYYPEFSFSNLPSIYFIDSMKGWAVGENVIITSNNGGQNWLPQNTITQTNFNSICFVDEFNGWAAGNRSRGNYVTRNTLLSTNDAGVTWVELGWEGSTNWGIRDLCFIDNEHGWGIRSTSFEEGDIIRTTDGGLNWQYSEDYDELRAIYFLDSINGWAVGPSGTILHSMNGGLDWADESMIDYSLSFNDVFFTDLSNGWIIGTYNDEGATYGKIYYTNNGGSSWEEQFSFVNVHLMNGCFIDSDKVWVVGDSIILHTSDGGLNWQQQTSGVLQLNSIYFNNANYGWAVGNTDIIHTIDGGLNWSQQTSGVYNNLNCVAFLDNDNGWIVGNKGVMLNTNNGGTVDIENSSTHIQRQFQVNSFPNPFSTSTAIEYELNQAETVTITFCNQFGKQVGVIVAKQQKGLNKIVWTPINLADGVYYFRLETGEQITTGKVLLMK